MFAGEVVVEEPDSGLDRLVLFSDGVFAIAITLLVLPLTEVEFEPGQVAHGLLELLPRFLVFALSFAVIGRYWVVHHALFGNIVRWDSRLLVLNLAFLFFVVLLPFPTSLLGGHSEEPASIVLYTSTLLLTVITSTLTWWYASRDHRLVRADLTETGRRARLWAGVAAGAALVPSIPLAFVSPQWAKISWLLLIPFGALAGRLRPID